MIDLLILTEKKSACDNFAKALGGLEGTFDGKSYKIVHAQGHLLKFKDPEYQVDRDLANKFKSWDPDQLPWDLSQLSWQKMPANINAKKRLEMIKEEAQNAHSIVIATDNDPSGEGDLIAWEIIKYINFDRTVYREYHDDESEKAIRKALSKLYLVDDTDGNYQKADARSRWDFASMQLTRAATSYARNAGYDVKVANQGRLKSVMVSLVLRQLEKIQRYQRKPFYEVRFKDDNGHIFLRKINPKDEENLAKARHQAKADAEKEMESFHESAIANVKRETRYKKPDPMLDLSKVDALLSKQGFTSKMVKQVYQKLYENQYLSYPRTEDKFITTEQFAELLDNSEAIANLLGVDFRLLTHTQARSTHVKDSATHGANRPGPRVPKSFDEFKEVVNNNELKCAKRLYELVARSALSILAEDYKYEHVTANLSDYPNFITNFNIPLEENWLYVFNVENKKEDQKEAKDIGTKATPFVYEGANPKPQAPTKDWLYTRLRNAGKYGVGTGATQQSTLSEITDPKSNGYLLKASKKGRLSLTPAGEVSGCLALNSMIESAKITISLFNGMERVAKKEMSIDKLVASVTRVANNDKQIFANNAKWLVNSEHAKDLLRMSTKINGSPAFYKDHWGDHKFTQDELSKLKAGEPLEFDYKKGHIILKFVEKTSKSGQKYFGLDSTFSRKDDDFKETMELDGKTIKFNKKWGKHTFTDSELEKLKAGETISFHYKSKKYDGMVSGKIEERLSNQGNSYWGFNAKFEPKEND